MSKLQAPAFCKHCQKVRQKDGEFFSFCRYHKASMRKTNQEMRERVMPALMRAFEKVSKDFK